MSHAINGLNAPEDWRARTANRSDDIVAFREQQLGEVGIRPVRVIPVIMARLDMVKRTMSASSLDEPPMLERERRVADRQ